MPVLIIFIFSALLLGSFHIGGISIRVLMAFVTTAYLYFNYNSTNKTKIKKKPLIIYSVFLLISLTVKLLSGAISGVEEMLPYFKRLFAFFLICYVSYFSIDKIVQTPKSLNQIFMVLIAICILNDVATYLQYIGNPIGIILGNIFYTSEGEYMDKLENNFDRLNEITMAIPGIFGHAAINGYMTSSLGILSLYYLVGKGKRYWILGLIFFIFAFLGSFCCQERSGMGLFLLFSIYSLWKLNSKILKKLLPLTIGVGLLFFYDSIINIIGSNDIGRYGEMLTFGSTRQNLINNAISFISENFILGGEVAYGQQYGLVPHNFFLHAVIASGIFGALIVYYLFFYMLRDAYRIIRKPKDGSCEYFFACGLSIYLLNGIFHTSSLISGDILIWIFYPLMLKGFLINKSRKTRKRPNGD